MRLGSDHRTWAVATTGVALAATAYYVHYARTSPYGPSGGSWPGLFFGVAGTALMIVAGLLAARKKVRTWRLGNARLWMKMHIWLSLLAVVFIWFHSGFAFGGTLTSLLMVVFYVVIASGIAGLALQQFVPSLMTASVPRETVRSQIDYVLQGLAADAYELVASVTGSLPEAEAERKRLEAEEAEAKRLTGFWKEIPRQRPAAAPMPGAQELKTFYLSVVRPFLWGDRRARASMPEFQPVVLQAPDEWRTKVEKLRDICEEARQLALQERLHAWLHGWLFVHAPLSFALFVLAAIHVCYALRY